VNVLFAGNPSTLLLLAWAGAFLAATRGRGLLAGALLATALITPPVGLPVAAALVLAMPGLRARLLQGFAIGTAIFLAANLAADFHATGTWAASLFPFAQSLDPHSAQMVQLCCLAGLSAPFLGLGLFAAAGIGAVLVAAPIAWLYTRGDLTAMSADRPLMLLALLMAAGLALTPYIHLNDLVLEALPLLVLASRPLGILGRGTLVLWGLSLPINLALAVALFTITGDVNKPWSYGVVLTGGTLLAITVAANRERARDPAAPAAAVA
jgi:hypothetical protein